MRIIKIGGGAAINYAGVVSDIAALAEPCVVVHGANALRDQLAERLGTPKQVLTSVSGYASVLSDEAAIDVILMSYAGLRNKRLVEQFQRAGVNAVGLPGIDGGLVQGTPAIKVFAYARAPRPSSSVISRANPKLLTGSCYRCF